MDEIRNRAPNRTFGVQFCKVASPAVKNGEIFEESSLYWLFSHRPPAKVCFSLTFLKTQTALGVATTKIFMNLPVHNELAIAIIPDQGI